MRTQTGQQDIIQRGLNRLKNVRVKYLLFEATEANPNG